MGKSIIATGENTMLANNKKDILTFLQTIWEPGDVREVRAFDIKKYAWYGYYDAPEEATKAILRRGSGIHVVYVTLNPCIESIFSRNPNEPLKQAFKDPTTTDKEIKNLKYLLIDCDPIRPANISSSEEELEYAKRVGEKIKAELGTPRIFGMSGNGYHLIYRHNAKNPEQIKVFLAKLQERFGNEKIAIDQTVFNPSRITKVLGTLAGSKGKDTKQRPHRMSLLIETNNHGTDVVLDIPELPTIPEKKRNEENKDNKDIQFDSEGYARLVIASNGYSIIKEKFIDGGSFLMCLDRCVFNEQHSENQASIGIAPDGTLFYQCFHNSCKGKKWEDIKNVLKMPDTRDFISRPASHKTKKCERCGKPIAFKKFNGKWKAINTDESIHKCKNFSKKDKNTKSKEKEQKKIINSSTQEIPEGIIRKVKDFVIAQNGIFLEEKINPAPEIPNAQPILIYTKICSDTVQIQERLNDIFGQESYVKISWADRFKIVPTIYLSNKNLDKLAGMGIRILSSNAIVMGKYFLACLEEMKEEKQFATRNGWQGERFIVGNKIVYIDRIVDIAVKDDALTVGQNGDKETWKKTVIRFMKNDVQLQIIMGASAFSPFLSKIACEGATVHFYQDSSSGKTFIFRMAASMWGLPEKIDEGRGICQNWHGSDASHEIYMDFMNHLPCFFDESQLFKNHEVVFNTVYFHANGYGKPRGTKEVNLDRPRTWCSFLLSTGERKVTDVANFGGMMARAIEIYRKKPNEEIAQTEFLQTKQILSRNYGFGTELIQFYLHNSEKINNRHKEILGDLEKYFKDLKSLQKRMLPRWAAIILGCQMNNEVFDFPYDEDKILTELQKSLTEDQESKGSQSLYDFAIEIFRANPGHFNLKTPGGFLKQVEDNIETWGIFDNTRNGVFFYPEVLKKIIVRAGYAYSQLSILKENGMLFLMEGQGLKFSIRINGNIEKFIGIRLPFDDENENLPTEYFA